MSIIANELKWYKAQTTTNTAANGGKMGEVQIVNAIRNNLFPDISEEQRTAGVTRYRKAFLKVANPDNHTLANSLIHLITKTPADDYVHIFEGTQTDTQGDISSPVEYGIGSLNLAIVAGDTTCEILLDDDSQEIFHNGCSIWISNGTHENYHHNVSISKDGAICNITLDSGDGFLNNFSSANTLIASCIDSGDIIGDVDDFTNDSSYGVLDETKIQTDNIGSIEENWTLTFTSATNFSCSGASLGVIGSGSTNSNYSPNNPVHNEPYFVIESDGFSGSFEEHDIIEFRTSPAAFPVWFKKIVPEATSSFSGNNFEFRVRGETV